MKFLIGFALFITAHANAVEVRNCPKEFIVEFTEFNVFSASRVRNELGRDNEDAEKVRQVLAKTKYLKEEFTLIGTKTGRCEYRGTGVVAVLATSKGKDWLRLEYQMGGVKYGELGAYITISRYSPYGLQTNGRATYGYSVYPGIFAAFLGSSSVKFR